MASKRGRLARGLRAAARQVESRSTEIGNLPDDRRVTSVRKTLQGIGKDLMNHQGSVKANASMLRQAANAIGDPALARKMSVAAGKVADLEGDLSKAKLNVIRVLRDYL